MRRYQPATAPWAILVLGHGAGAGASHPWMRRIGERLAGAGVEVVTFDFPYMAAGRHVPDRGPVLEAAFADVWRDTSTAVRPIAPPPIMFAGGKSMGGRISSQAAARSLFDPAPAGLLFFGYPLHPPAKPEQRRDRHLPSVGAPMLFLQGTRDPFGAPDEMRALVSTLPNSTLELVEGGNHSLETTKRDDPNGARFEAAVEFAVQWMRDRRQNRRR